MSKPKHERTLEDTEAQAITRNIRVSPRKLNLVAGLIRGRRAPIIGSVCMDMIMIDVTGLDASPGDEVVFIGSQGGDTIDAREMAETIGTIPWEIVCRVGTRIERVYA